MRIREACSTQRERDVARVEGVEEYVGAERPVVVERLCVTAFSVSRQSKRICERTVDYVPAVCRATEKSERECSVRGGYISLVAVRTTVIV